MKSILEQYNENIFRNTCGHYVLIFGNETLYFAFEQDLIFHLENYGLRSI